MQGEQIDSIAELYIMGRKELLDPGVLEEVVS